MSYTHIRIYPATIVIVSFVLSFVSPVKASGQQEPYEKEFVVTAYYSSLPNQCCYYRGSYDEEVAFNGNGQFGADGTPVYEGMLAAPSNIPFGTRIKIPGHGIGTVHDRGSRIVNWPDGTQRIDIWMGKGEEGLARSLAFGIQRIKGTVYPEGNEMPKETLSFASLPVDLAGLPTVKKPSLYLILTGLKAPERRYGVKILQKILSKLKYFNHAVTGLFGPVTMEAVYQFKKDHGLNGDGSFIEDETAAMLIAAKKVHEKSYGPKLTAYLRRGMSGKKVSDLQRTMRYLGYYRGRSDGRYGLELKDAILKFQKGAGIVVSASDAGAGMVGPITREAIRHTWLIKQTKNRAKSVVLNARLASEIAGKILPSKTLAKGDSGQSVRALQTFLIGAGYLPAKDLTGYFGDRTETALVQFQIDSKVVKTAETRGAGVFGPATRSVMKIELLKKRIAEVKEHGVGSL